MKATCIRRLVNKRPFFIVEKDETVDVSIDGDNVFTVNGIPMTRSGFFHHFKTDNPEVKMSYSDFEHILRNYVFTMALIYPEYISNGEHFLIIKDWCNKRIYISCNEKENSIRVSFNHGSWDQYTSYEDAMEDICNHK